MVAVTAGLVAVIVLVVLVVMLVVAAVLCGCSCEPYRHELRCRSRPEFGGAR